MSTGSSVRPLRPGQRVWLNHTTGATSRTSTAATSSPLGQERFRVALTPEPAPVDAHRIDEPEDLGYRPWSPLLATSSAAFRSRSRPTCAACFSPEGTTAPLLGPGQSIWAATGVQVDLLEPIADDPPRAAPVVSQLVRAAVGHTDQADGFRSTSGRVQWSGVSPCGSPGAVCAPQAFRTPRVRVNSMSSTPAPFAIGLATG